MNINPENIAAQLALQLPTFTALAVRALEKSGGTERAASVSWKCNIKIVKGRAVMISVCKIKTPQGIHSDLTSATDEEEIGSWDLNEAPGQQTIND